LHWNARHESYGQSSGSPRPFRGRPGQPGFATRGLAEADAQRTIPKSDVVKDAFEFFRRLQQDEVA
jgi:hypothetical protein